MVHGFQLFDIWQRHLMDSGVDYLDFQKTYKQAAGDKLLFHQLSPY
jgi:autocrine motility factor receptor